MRSLQLDLNLNNNSWALKDGPSSNNFPSYILIILKIMYLKEEEKQRLIIWWFTLQKATTAGAVPGRRKEPKTQSRSHGGDKDTTIRAIMCCSPACTLTGSGDRSAVQTETQHASMGCGCPKWHGNCCAKCLPHILILEGL